MTEPTPSDPAGPKRRGTRVRHGLRVIWLVAMAPVLFAVIAAAMMIDREISAPSWVTTRIEARVAQMLGGGRLEFGEIVMRVGSDLHPHVALRDTVLIDANGVPLARIAQITGLVSPRGLLFDRTALMQEVALSGAQVDLRRNVDGSVAVAFERGASDAGARDPRRRAAMAGA